MVFNELQHSFGPRFLKGYSWEKGVEREKVLESGDLLLKMGN